MGTVDPVEVEQQQDDPANNSNLELRAARRQKRKRELAEQCNWELTSFLATVAAEVEDIANEVCGCMPTRHACCTLNTSHIPPQAARLRYMWNTPMVVATDVELSEEQKQKLADEHKTRLRDLLQKTCGGALKLIMQHKVGFM